MTAAPTSYVCPCGAGHPFAAWVYAHLDGELEHACPECGRVNLLIHGVLDQRMNGARAQEARAVAARLATLIEGKQLSGTNPLRDDVRFDLPPRFWTRG